MNVLFDTCIIIDGLQQRTPHCEEANKLFYAVGNQLITGFITAKSLADIHYLTHKNLHSQEATRLVLKNLVSIFYVLDATSNDCFNALSSQTKDFEDAIMCETAKRENMDCIVTRNEKDYDGSATQILTPKELLAILENE